MNLDCRSTLLLITSLAISALVVGIEMIGAHCKKNKWRRKIVLITDGRGPMDDDDLGEIARKMKDDGIELVVLYVSSWQADLSLADSGHRGIDFDDPEFGVKEEDKDPWKVRYRNHHQVLNV